MKNGAVIVGSGGHAQVLWAAFQALPDPHVRLLGWLETASYKGPEQLLDLPILRQSDETLRDLLRQGCDSFYFGLGTTHAMPERLEIYRDLCKAGLKPLSLIHPSAIIDPTAEIGPGAFIGAGAIAQPFARIGEACIVNTAALIEHHARIGDNVHCAPRSVLCGEVSVGAHSLIGAGSVVIQRIHIGANVTIGAGSTVIGDINDDTVAVGNPARATVHRTDAIAR